MVKIGYALLICALGGALFLSCTVSGPGSGIPQVVSAETKSSEIERPVALPEIKRGPYRPERTKAFDLLHTSIEARFDWSERQMHGTVTLRLRPYFYRQEILQLDARGMDIHRVSLLEGDSARILNYSYLGDSLLRIGLGRSYSRSDDISLRIDYTTNTYRRDTKSGKAILSDRGLYFVNADGSRDDVPMQIWTQGETSSNSRWFPTIDAPNQRCTQEMYITVDDRFTTLSNGRLVTSRNNPDGTRTDYWRMDQAHAPYLFMMAVGEFSIVREQVGDLEFEYYVEPEYERYALDIFGRTPTMTAFFSDLLGYPYPWPKYAQVVVRDFVSGAMENTSASVYMEDVQVNRRSLIDSDWDDIIAHELFHQWFGNLVTCESWSNLVLNEGFATYAEYLWKHHYRGVEEADYKLYEEWLDYYDESVEKKTDLVRFHYDDEDDLFDSHSYAKGALVLHMLRREVGDEAFFESVRYYLRKHAFSDVEIHHLRLAFEEVTGRDLNWFFNQWFLASGHPELEFEDEYDSSTGLYRLSVRQAQDTHRYPVYRLKIPVDLWVEGNLHRNAMEVEGLEAAIEWQLPAAPELVAIDPEGVMVAEYTFERPASQYRLQYSRYTGTLRARLQALEYFEEGADSLARETMYLAINDPAAPLRQKAIMFFDDGEPLSDDLIAVLRTIASDDPVSLVRADALALLLRDDPDTQLIRKAMQDSSYAVYGEALYAFLQLPGLENEQEWVIEQNLDEEDFNITSVLADRFIERRDYRRYDWFESKVRRSRGQYQWYMVRLFGFYLLAAPDSLAKAGIEAIANIARDHPHYFLRSAAVNSLQLLSDRDGVGALLDRLMEEEDDERVRSYME